VKQPFLGGGIGGLGVHVDEAVTLLHRDQVIFGFPVGVAAFLAPDLCPGRKKLFAPAGVFYMADLFLAANFYMGNEPVGPPQEYTGHHMFVSHNYSLKTHSYCIGQSLPCAKGSEAN